MSAPGIAVAECLDEDELVLVIDAAGPLEEDIAFFCSSGLGEVVDQGEPFRTTFRTDGEFDDDEDQGSLRQGFAAGAAGPRR